MRLAIAEYQVIKTGTSFVLMVLLAAVGLPFNRATADGSSIDKVYHPYVQVLESEVEYRSRYQHDEEDDLDGQQRHLLGLGRSFSDRVFGEIYFEANKSETNSFSVDAIEAEIKIQLTEQGEYNSDWGVMFELERETAENSWEASSSLIILHEWSNWIATTNIGLIYEWGKHMKNEWETSFSTQFRYRYRQFLEPAIEVYLSESSAAIGPVLSGMLRTGGRQKIIWESGVIFGVDNKTPDVSLKFTIDYEF